MSRTNKMWIAKSKKKKEKQKKLLTDWVSNLNQISEKRNMENPNWNLYLRFFRSWKYICDITSCREDPDWYRVVRDSWSMATDFKFYWKEWWWYRRYIRKNRKNLKIK